MHLAFCLCNLVLFLGHRYVFGAGWLQALVIGFLGGMIGWALFALVLRLLKPVA